MFLFTTLTPRLRLTDTVTDGLPPRREPVGAYTSVARLGATAPPAQKLRRGPSPNGRNGQPDRPERDTQPATKHRCDGIGPPRAVRRGTSCCSAREQNQIDVASGPAPRHRVASAHRTRGKGVGHKCEHDVCHATAPIFGETDTGEAARIDPEWNCLVYSTGWERHQKTQRAQQLSV